MDPGVPGFKGAAAAGCHHCCAGRCWQLLDQRGLPRCSWEVDATGFVQKQIISCYLVETQSFRIQCARTGAMGKDLVALLKARDEKKPKNLDVTYENSFYVLILYPLHVSTHFQRSATRLAETQESCWPCWCAQAPCFEASCCIFEGASS